MHCLTLKQEMELSETIVSLHPHKVIAEAIEPKVYIIRKGWPSFLKFQKKQREFNKENKK